MQNETNSKRMSSSVVTPQTNTTLSEIAERLVTLDDFVICGHVSPDGDCLGSQLGLYHALKNLGKSVTCLLARNEPIEMGLQFLPAIDRMVPASEYEGPARVFIAVDVPSVERLGTAATLHDQAEMRFTVDHHAYDVAMAEHTYVDPDSPSATMLIWELVKLLGEDLIDKQVATCCLTGLITDTGRFSYQNTTVHAFEWAAEMMRAGADPALINREFFQNRSIASLRLESIALERMEFFVDGAFVLSYLTQDDFKSCGAVKADAEILIDVLRSIHKVRVALILRENKYGEVRGSLRAKDDTTDVSRVARHFDGGGHKAAAGFTYHGFLPNAIDEVKHVVLSYCFDEHQSGLGDG